MYIHQSLSKSVDDRGQKECGRIIGKESHKSVAIVFHLGIIKDGIPISQGERMGEGNGQEIGYQMMGGIVTVAVVVVAILIAVMEVGVAVRVATMVTVMEVVGITVLVVMMARVIPIIGELSMRVRIGN